MMGENHGLEIDDSPDIVKRATDEIISKTKLQYRLEFEKALESYRTDVGPLPERIEGFVREKGWLEPRFETFSGVEADEELKRIGFRIEDQAIGENETLMVYQCPKPLTQFWNKRVKEVVEHEYYGKDRPKQIQFFNGGVIEWGYFGKKLKDVIWEVVTKVQNEYGYDLKILRANEFGDHTEDFYYVFLISEE